MANKNIFTSTNTRFPSADTTNEAGGRAYQFDSKHALAQLAAQVAQHLALFRQLDPLGQRPQTEGLAQAHDRVGDPVLVRAPLDDSVHERLGDLDDVGRELAQVLERGVAGTEVVDRHLDAQRLQLVQALDRRLDELESTQGRGGEGRP